LGSRRTSEEWTRAGRVTIGGRVARLGDRATSADEVCLDGAKLQLGGAPGAARELLLYYKPVGEVAPPRRPARRPAGVPPLAPARHRRLIAGGAAERDTSGLLLLT